ncbi:hypothetical protein M1145_01840 [Patescibacteria group bacterium]|nr:hypothetical protein [Patescibacteria group bacterium]
MKRRNNKKSIKYIVFTILFIFVVLFIVFFVNIIKLKTIHFKNDVGFSKNTYTNTWEGKNTFNVLVVYKYDSREYSLNTYNAILSITPNEGISIMALPSNLTLFSPGTNNSSTNILDTVYPLANLNNPKTGISTLIKDIRYNFGITIDAYLSLSSKNLSIFSKSLNIFSLHNIKISNINISKGENNLSIPTIQKLLSIRKDTTNTLYIKNTIFIGILSKILNTFNLFTLHSSIDKVQALFNSNMGTGDTFLMFYSLYNIGVSKIKLLEYPYSGTINFKAADSFIRANFLNSSFSSSNVSVQILDSSSNNAAVYQFSRFIENLGGTVSSIGIYNNALGRDVIYVQNGKKYQYEIKEIVSILGKNNVKIINKNPAFFYTGSIIVILGSRDSYIL